jgi:hypothetical protein
LLNSERLVDFAFAGLTGKPLSSLVHKHGKVRDMAEPCQCGMPEKMEKPVHLQHGLADVISGCL